MASLLFLSDTRLVLEAVAAAEGIEASQEEIDKEIESRAETYNRDVEELKETYGESGRKEISQDICVKKAIVDLLPQKYDPVFQKPGINII